MMKRFTLLLISLVLVAAMAGCTSVPPAISDSGEDSRILLDWYINFSWYSASFGNNAVSRALTDKTGVDIRFVSPEGNESVTLNTLIAGDMLPDLVTLGWWEPQFSEIIDKGLVWPLNELADDYCPSFWTVADADRVRWYTKEDGNLYCYPNSSYSPANYEQSNNIASNQTFLVRKDIYEALGCPDMTTTQGFADAVRMAAEMFPTVDGQPLIPIGAHEFTERGCDSFDIFLLNFLAVPNEVNGEYYDRYSDEEYKLWLSMFRQLGQEGLLSSDIFIDKRKQMEEKIAQGRYFCMLYQRTDIAEQQYQLSTSDPDSVYIAVDGPRNSAGDDHALPGSGINGWTVTLISRNCKDPQKAIEMVTYMMSEEGQKLIALGIEGEHYTMVDGKAVLTPTTQELIKNSYETYIEQVGANDAYWMLQDNLMQSQWMPDEDPVIQQMKDWCYPYTFYTGQYDVFFTDGSDADVANEKIVRIHSEMLPQLLLAPDQETFDRLWDEYCLTRKEAGIDIVLKESTRQMNENKRRLNMQ